MMLKINAQALSKMLALMPPTPHPEIYTKGVVVERHGAGIGATLMRTNGTLFGIWHDAAAEVEKPALVLKKSPLVRFLKTYATDVTSEVEITAQDRRALFRGLVGGIPAGQLRIENSLNVLYNFSSPGWQGMAWLPGAPNGKTGAVYAQKEINDFMRLAREHVDYMAVRQSPGEEPALLMVARKMPLVGLLPAMKLDNGHYPAPYMKGAEISYAPPCRFDSVCERVKQICGLQC